MKKNTPLFARMEILLSSFQEDNPLQALTQKHAKLFKEFAHFFKLPPNEAQLLCVCIHLYLQEEYISYKNISVVLKEPIIRVMNRKQEIDELKAREMIYKLNQRVARWTEEGNKRSFVLNDKVIRALMDNKPYSETCKDEKEDWLDILFAIYDLAKQREAEELDTVSLFQLSQDMIHKHQELPLFQYVINLNISEVDAYILLYCIASYLSGEEEINMNAMVSRMIEHRTLRVRILQSLSTKANDLMRKDLLTFSSSTFFDYAQVTLTDKLLGELESMHITNKINGTKLPQGLIISPDTLKPKQLFYNSEEAGQLDVVAKMLMPEPFEAFCTRMLSKHLKPGLIVLLYGEPGTGKTESVYQFAKQSGRGIIKVDISQAKSSFFGESEKKIKQIFTQYKQALEQQPIAPILLFNEADALIGQRRNLSEHHLMQTENAMQNILLEELENFEGILMATTNRAEHMDPAYDRRFLYKIKFKAPEASVREFIWRDKLPELSETDAQYLAKNFPLSGAQIDNVVRKIDMHYIVHSREASLELIRECCLQEMSLRKTGKKIGFVMGE